MIPEYLNYSNLALKDQIAFLLLDLGEKTLENTILEHYKSLVKRHHR